MFELPINHTLGHVCTFFTELQHQMQKTLFQVLGNYFHPIKLKRFFLDRLP